MHSRKRRDPRSREERQTSSRMQPRRLNVGLECGTSRQQTALLVNAASMFCRRQYSSMSRASRSSKVASDPHVERRCPLWKYPDSREMRVTSGITAIGWLMEVVSRHGRSIRNFRGNGAGTEDALTTEVCWGSQSPSARPVSCACPRSL